MTEEMQNGKMESETPPVPMRYWRRHAKPLVGVAILGVLILWSIGVFHKRTAADHLAYQAGLPVPANAKLLKVKLEPVAPRVDVVGTVASGTKVNLCARMPAYVTEVFVSAGSSVKKGQELVTLDDREIQEQAAASEAQFKQAETEMNRTRQLFENQAATEQAFTSAQSLFTIARAQRERSRVMLTDTRITAPIDGIVTDRHVEPGDLAAPGQTLMAVYDPANMQLEVPVPVRLLAKLPVGQTVEITLDRPATNFQGRVRQIVSEIDPLSRTQLVKVHIEKTSGDVLPGTFGRLWVADDARPAIVIPAAAVYRAGQIELVQIVKDQRAIRRAVRTGPRHGTSVEILSGLDAGDLLLLNPIEEN